MFFFFKKKGRILVLGLLFKNRKKIIYKINKNNLISIILLNQKVRGKKLKLNAL